MLAEFESTLSCCLQGWIEHTKQPTTCTTDKQNKVKDFVDHLMRGMEFHRVIFEPTFEGFKKTFQQACQEGGDTPTTQVNSARKTFIQLAKRFGSLQLGPLQLPEGAGSGPCSIT